MLILSCTYTHHKSSKSTTFSYCSRTQKFTLPLVLQIMSSLQDDFFGEFPIATKKFIPNS